jgi:hypothetical protein
MCCMYSVECLAQPPTIVKQIKVEGMYQTGCMHIQIKDMIDDYVSEKLERMWPRSESAMICLSSHRVDSKKS